MTRSGMVPKPAPQHQMLPPEVSAQAVPNPMDTAVTPLVSVETATGTALFVVEPFPSWPVALLPQHSTAPFTTAQAESLAGAVPTETLVTPLPRPATAAGTRFCPNPLLPQHSTPPFTTAQA